MIFKRFLYRSLIASPLLLNVVSGFGFRTFLSAPNILTGSSVSIVFTSDSPPLVTFKLAVENSDHSLTSIESNNAYNMRTSDFTQATILRGVEPGINYWFIAVDSENPSNYASLGPFAINEMFSNTNPSKSVTADDGVAYKTAGNAIASSTTTDSTAKTTMPSEKQTIMPASPSGSEQSKTKDLPTNSLEKPFNNEDKSSNNHIAVIVGSVAGFAVLVLIIWFIRTKNLCGIPHTVKTYQTNNNNDIDNSTKKETSYVTKINSSQENNYTHTDSYQLPQYTESHRPYVYPQEDTMPVPHHFDNNNSQSYSPFAPIPQQTEYNKINQTAYTNLQYNDSGVAHSASVYPPTINQYSKTETTTLDNPFSQKFEVIDSKTDKEEYHQKPDDTSNVPAVFNKPDDVSTVKTVYDKPNDA